MGGSIMAVVINGTTGIDKVQDGSIGTADLASGAVTAAKLDIGQIGGRRNLIINGAMQIYQRGQSHPSSNGYGSMDRWFIWGANGSFSRTSASAPSNTGIRDSLSATSMTGEYTIAQGIDLVYNGNAGIFYSGQTITLSYYARSTNASDSLYNFISFRDSVGSSSNQVVIDNDNTDTNQLSTTWQRFSKTYTISVSPVGTNTCLVVMPRSGSTPAGDIYITGIQLEIGDIATPYEHVDANEELQKCQRYFFSSIYANGNAYGNTGTALQIYHTYTAGPGWEWATANLPTTMRSTPTFVVYDAAGTAGKIAKFTSSAGQVTNNITPYGYGGNRQNVYINLYNDSGHYGFFAHYTADSEL